MVAFINHLADNALAAIIMAQNTLTLKTRYPIELAQRKIAVMTHQTESFSAMKPQTSRPPL